MKKVAKKFGKHKFFIVSLQWISRKGHACYGDVRDGREMVARRIRQTVHYELRPARKYKTDNGCKFSTVGSTLPAAPPFRSAKSRHFSITERENVCRHRMPGE